jgi:aerobic carbon-monoxide dehydrogenase medium subunit
MLPPSSSARTATAETAWIESPRVYAAPFEHVEAGSWGEAVELLAEHGDDARPIAGGQSLVPLMMLRLAEPAVLVDLGRIGRGTIERQGDRLVVPALTRHAEVAASSVVHRACPVLADAAASIGNVRVRNRGTIGGSLAHAEPTAELCCVAVALDGQVQVRGPGGERTMPATELLVGYLQTSLEPVELITAVDLPILRPGSGAAFAEVARRVGDFATAEAAAVVSLEGDGSCSGVRVVVGAAGDRPIDVSGEASGLQGRRPDRAAIDDAATEVARSLELTDGGHGSPAYRRRLFAVVVRRAIEAAAGRAANGGAA